MLANFLTFLRIIIIPILLIIFYIDNFYSSVILPVIFVIGGLTDFFDGLIARKFNQVTEIGKFLDPIADKLLTITGIFIILANNVNNIKYLMIPSLIIVLREIIISAMREYMAEKKNKNIIAVNIFGKIKTVFLFISISIIMFSEHYANENGKFLFIGYFMYYISSIISVYSISIYIRSLLIHIYKK